MTEMVDRVAAVLMGHVNAPEAQIRDAARAVLAVAPTDEMIKAGATEIDICWGYMDDDGSLKRQMLTEAAEAMREKALEEPPKMYTMHVDAWWGDGREL